ncbi:hypothetical protein [Vagococcus sp.]|uniref:hypothetical protein n=1 Tax=Vagococcus sp. TaxID=1933889 RepID=UPI003F998A8C
MRKNITLESLENKVFEYQKRHQDLADGQAFILNRLMGTDCCIYNDKDEVIAYTPIEKLESVIEELQALKKEIEVVERFEDFLYE